MGIPLAGPVAKIANGLRGRRCVEVSSQVLSADNTHYFHVYDVRCCLIGVLGEALSDRPGAGGVRHDLE